MELIPQNNSLYSASADHGHLIEAFLADTQNIKESTKLRYRKSLKKYFDWVKGSGFSLDKITLTELLIYKKRLSEQKTTDGKNLSPFTVGAYLTALRIFYEWANSKGLMFNPAKALEIPSREAKFERQPLSVAQATDLITHFKKASARDYAIVNLMIRCGLRTIEVCRLDIPDIQTRMGTRILLVQGKGKIRKDKFVKLLDKAYLPIQEYLCGRDIGPIFVSESKRGIGDRLIPTRISKIVKEGLRSIGINDPNYTAHSLRHTSGTAVIRAGGTGEQTQEMLRHSNISTTDGYIATVKEEKRLTGRSAEDILDEIF